MAKALFENEVLAGNVVQIRTFENKNLIYQGMKTPVPIQHLFEKIIENLLDKADNPTEKRAVLQELKAEWFQTVAEYKGFAQSANARIYT